jgi:NAD(P)-dependent dehydrogenase (short-subunit alcohol dehydrogenase family)
MVEPQPLNTQSLEANCLNGKIYLITGATGGLGRETALTLSRFGATVILSARNVQKLEQLYDEIDAAGYPQAAIIPFDLSQSDEQEYAKISTTIFNEFKKLDGLVHAACAIGYVAATPRQESKSWLDIHQVNLHAAFMLTKACLPLLMQSEHASCLFISDSSARNSKAYWGAYGVSKVALESFACILADELDSSSVTSNILIPGPSILPIRKKTHPGEDNTTLRLATEVANTVVAALLTKQTGKVFTS